MTDIRHRVAITSERDDLYRTDFVAWTRDQAEALRVVARDPWPAGTDLGLDWDNVAEEIESLGTSQRSALGSQIRRILHHLLKLEFSFADAPRHDWRRSIREARVEIQDVLRKNPSLVAEIASAVADQSDLAVKLAIGDLEDHGELEGATRIAIEYRRYHPHTEALADWWPGSPGTSA